MSYLSDLELDAECLAIEGFDGGFAENHDHDDEFLVDGEFKVMPTCKHESMMKWCAVNALIDVQPVEGFCIDCGETVYLVNGSWGLVPL